MRFAAFRDGNQEGLAFVSPNREIRGHQRVAEGYPRNLHDLIQLGRDEAW